MNLKLISAILLIFCGSAVAQPHRIISLTPSITEQLYLLGEGEKVIGITNFCRKIYPYQEIVGTYLQPNIEKIVLLKPDIVIVSKEGIQKEIVQKIKQFDIETLVLDPVDSYEQLKEQFITLSKIFNKKDVAEKIISDYEKKYFKSPKKKFRAVCVLGIEPLIVASDISYIGEIISFSGLENPVKLKVKYPQINIEELLKWDPEVIIAADTGISGEKRIKKYFEKYKQLSAVKNNRILILDANMLYQPTIKNFWLSVEAIKEKMK